MCSRGSSGSGGGREDAELHAMRWQRCANLAWCGGGCRSTEMEGVGGMGKF